MISISLAFSTRIYGSNSFSDIYNVVVFPHFQANLPNCTSTLVSVIKRGRNLYYLREEYKTMEILNQYSLYTGPPFCFIEEKHSKVMFIGNLKNLNEQLKGIELPLYS